MKLIISLIFSCLIIQPLLSYSEEKHGHEVKPKTSAVESLSPELRSLLSKEMIALQSGMMEIIPALVSGSWHDIELIASKMKDSYIMKQNITDEQAEELHTLLSESFIKQDQEFHYLAGMLNHAAKNKKKELVSFYFSRMGESCLACHTQFATHKFKGLAPLEKLTHVHHH